MEFVCASRVLGCFEGHCLMDTVCFARGDDTHTQRRDDAATRTSTYSRGKGILGGTCNTIKSQRTTPPNQAYTVTRSLTLS
jgi:hypothetical protein